MKKATMVLGAFCAVLVGVVLAPYLAPPAHAATPITLADICKYRESSSHGLRTHSRNLEKDLELFARQAVAQKDTAAARKMISIDVIAMADFRAQLTVGEALCDSAFAKQ